jgi:uncharacterized protein YjgD (DUF1641 family)
VNDVAQPIPLNVPPADPRTRLQARLEAAPAEHAEALLGAYEVLQGLHDRGLFALLRGALGSRDKVLEVVVGAAESPASVRAIRNLLLLLNMLAAIEPEVLKSFTEAAPRVLKMMLRQPERPGLWMLIKDFLWNQDFRHGMATINTMIEAFGRSLSSSTGSYRFTNRNTASGCERTRLNASSCESRGSR